MTDTPMPEVPTTYEADMRSVVKVLDTLDQACSLVNGESDLYVDRAIVVVANANGYCVGTLHYEDGQWRFTAYADWAEETNE